MKKIKAFTSLLLAGTMMWSVCSANNCAKGEIAGGGAAGAKIADLAKNEEKREFVIEKAYTSTKVYKEAGCTPRDAVIVFFTSIPDVKFSMPNTPGRLLRVSEYDAKNNCYMLCVIPTEKEGQYANYSIMITARGYKTEEAYLVSDINPGIVQHFMINPKQSSQPDRVENAATSSENLNSDDKSQKTFATIYSSLNWYIEGETNRMNNYYSEAIRCYLKALDADPLFSDAWNGLANVYYLQGNYKGAIEYYKKLAEKFNSETIWNKMGLCYQQLQEYDNAIDCFQKSNNIVDNGSAWYGMGICYAKKKNHTKSMGCMTKAAQLGHEDAQKLLTGMNRKW